jgi:predicted metalloprotease with PDZ domain
MPYINGRGTWLMEGAATFVEPIIRARAGWKTEAEAWKEWIDNMPRGTPAFAAGLANAQGNQNYWSGATFMLMADIGIRRATKGGKGLEDCLGGVLWSGLDATQRVSVQEFARACDRASETDVVSTLVDQHFQKQQPVDLAALWKDLGVAEVGGRIVFDDTAPLAEWRKMIVMGPTGRPSRPVKLPWQS